MTVALRANVSTLNGCFVGRKPVKTANRPLRIESSELLRGAVVDHLRDAVRIHHLRLAEPAFESGRFRLIMARRFDSVAGRFLSAARLLHVPECALDQLVHLGVGEPRLAEHLRQQLLDPLDETGNGGLQTTAHALGNVDAVLVRDFLEAARARRCG